MMKPKLTLAPPPTMTREDWLQSIPFTGTLVEPMAPYFGVIDGGNTSKRNKEWHLLPAAP
jgi:hypothetical protein